MIEEIIIQYLNPDVSCYAEVPAEFPKNPRFCVVEKTGGGKSGHLFHSTVAIQSYAATRLDAAERNEQVKALMEGLLDLDEIVKVKLNADYNFSDTAAKRYRYQAVYDIIHY